MLEVSGAMSKDDPMWWRGPSDTPRYLESGASALRSIRLALLSAEKQDVTRVLDMACGYGRQLRAIRAAFPDAELVGCDIDRAAVDFCAKNFGAVPVYSSPDPAEIDLEGPFDLIWSGSLFTHIGEPQWEAFFSLFNSILAPGGLMVVSTHGRYAFRRLQSAEFSYGLDQASTEKAVGDFDRRGFAFVPAETNRSAGVEGTYGISFCSPSWTCSFAEKFPRLRVVGYAERGWHDHHDVIACQAS